MTYSYWYSTNPVLTWCFNHYFFEGVHRLWIASPFYPYRSANPASSNPFLLYQQLYMPWKDRDDFSKVIEQYRLAARSAVLGHRASLSRVEVLQLSLITEEVDLELFLPIVYRVDLTRIERRRLQILGSGLRGSREYLIADLREDEFDLMLLEDAADTRLEALLAGTMTRPDVLAILKGRRRRAR